MAYRGLAYLHSLKAPSQTSQTAACHSPQQLDSLLEAVPWREAGLARLATVKNCVFRLRWVRNLCQTNWEESNALLVKPHTTCIDRIYIYIIESFIIYLYIYTHIIRVLNAVPDLNADIYRYTPTIAEPTQFISIAAELKKSNILSTTKKVTLPELIDIHPGLPVRGISIKEFHFSCQVRRQALF